MRITVLGGYAAAASTGAGSSGYLVRHRGTSVVADLGPGTLGELRRQVDVRALDGIVVSHGHLDHIWDLAALHHLVQYAPTPLPRRIPLHLPPGSRSAFEVVDRAVASSSGRSMLSESFEVSEYDPAVPLAVGDVAITFAPTVHFLPTWAMRFSSDGSGGIGYTADTGPTADLAALFSGVDVLVAEATTLKAEGPAEERGHLTAGEAGSLASRAGASTLVLSHRWDEHDGAAQRAEAASVFDGRIELSSPGLTVEASASGN